MKIADLPRRLVQFNIDSDPLREVRPRLPREKKREVIELLKQGLRLGDIQRQTGVTKDTAGRYRNKLIAVGELPDACPNCGRPIHRGQCLSEVIAAYHRANNSSL